MKLRRLLITVTVVLTGAGLFASATPSLALHWFFGLAFGWVLLRAGFCFVAAIRDPVLTGSTSVARGLLAAITVATAGFALVTLTTGITGTVAPAGLNTVVGGFIFGAAMVVAGGCVSGTLMRMGDGFLMQWAAFAGLLGGSLLGARACCTWNSPLLHGAQRVFLPDHIGWLPSLALQAAVLGLLWWAAARHERIKFGAADPAGEDAYPDPVLTGTDIPTVATGPGTSLRLFKRARQGAGAFFDAGWTPLRGGVALGVLNVAYFALAGRPWGITTELTYWASGLWRLLGQHPETWAFFSGSRGLPTGAGLLAYPGTALNLGLIIGAFLASYVAGQWRVRRVNSWRQTVAALGGGLVMGYGSRLAFGCNIGALFSGTASLSLHGWVYLVSLGLGALVGIRLADIFLFRPALKRLRTPLSGSATAGHRLPPSRPEQGVVACRRR